MQKFFFLNGLPRAGNTLFASIMNQNPDINTTGNSLIPTLMYGINELKYDQAFNFFKDHKSIDNVLNNVFNNYYSDWKGKYIIDRGVWGTPYNLKLLQDVFNDDFKIIVLVRDLKEIIASFIRFSYLTDDNFIAKKVKGCDTIESRFHAVYTGSLQKDMLSIITLLKPENKKYCHLIEYNDLVNNTKKEISDVYDYLGIEQFEHDFGNLTQLKHNGIEYDDYEVGKGLHTIMTDGVKKREYDMNDYLPKDLSNYELDPIWKQ